MKHWTDKGVRQARMKADSLVSVGGERKQTAPGQKKIQLDVEVQYSQGSSSGLSVGGITKVKACKSFLFTERSLKVENKMIGQIVGLSKDCDQNGDRMSNKALFSQTSCKMTSRRCDFG